jgi:putative endonuclease
MARHNELGKKGENLAKKMLVDKGYTIVETNWRFDKDEIDIIAKDGDELVIVEVKTRSTDFYGFPEDAVNLQKEEFLIRATEAYLEENNLDLDTRFDIVSIILNKKEANIHHIVDAFYPE